MKKRDLFDFLCIAVYAILTLAVVLHHEAWRDEAQTWLVVRDSGFLDMFFHQIRWQGHPFLWYLILFPLAKAGLPFLTQQIVHWVIAVAAVFVFVRFSPFPWFVRYIFPFGLFMFHEYVVISRNYGLATLILFIAAAFYPKRLRRPLVYALIIFCLFNSHYFLFSAAGALAILFVWDVWRERRFEGRYIFSIGLMAAGAVLALLQGFTLPKTHAQANQIHEPNFYTPFISIGRAFFPTAWDISNWLAIALAVFIVAAVCLLLWKHRQALWGFLLCWAGIFYIFIFRYTGFQRHRGFLLMTLLAFLWIAFNDIKNEDERVWKWRFRDVKRFVTILIALALLLSTRYSVWANYMDLKYCFSGSRPMARAIRETSKEYPLQEKIIVAYPTSNATSVAVYLPDWKFWYPDLNAFGSFNQLEKSQNDSLSAGELFIRTGKEFGDITGVYFLFANPMPIKKAFGYKFQLLRETTTRVFGYGLEKYYLYRAVK